MRFLLNILALIILTNATFGVPKANYDESKVPQIKLPNILSIPGGAFTAKSALDWNQKVRPVLADIFENKIYGKIPPRPSKEFFEVVEASDDALGGKAIRRQIKITVADAKGEKSFIMLLYLPKSKVPSPVFLGLNFMGNHATTKDPNVIMPNWVRNTSTGKVKITDNKPTEESRGMQSRRWPFEKIVERGFGIATIYYCDIYPDLEKCDGAPQSIYSIFEKPLNGAISAWSWGLSRALDALETIPEADAKNVIAIGHSRLGKTALLAAALDTRFAGCVSNNSGCMGAAISRRQFGETIEAITRVFPYWFKPQLREYANKESELPIDQHQLLALIAPALSMSQARAKIYGPTRAENFWRSWKPERFTVFSALKIFRRWKALKSHFLETSRTICATGSTTLWNTTGLTFAIFLALSSLNIASKLNVGYKNFLTAPPKA